MVERANGKVEEEEEEEKRQGEKPFCAVNGVGKANGGQTEKRNKWPTRSKGAGNNASINMQQQYDENSYLSVTRTRNILGGSDEEGQRNWGHHNIGELFDENDGGQQHQHALTAAISPFRVLTALTHCENADWDELREVRVRELAETRQRVMLMENTMRWWLSAAEQWREKWQKLKNERSRLREENLRLRNALSFAKVELFEHIGLKRCENCAVKLLKKNCINKLIFRPPKDDAMPKREGKVQQQGESEEWSTKSANGRGRMRRRTLSL